jgi:tRNA A37 threonylcarbamoyladenosine dehydratase
MVLNNTLSKNDEYSFEFLNRTRRLLGTQSLVNLAHATILIAGCGGVGGASAITLARMGVGKFILADPGFFDPPDANRQWGADLTSMGNNKAIHYAELLQNINPNIKVLVYKEGVTTQNVEELVNEADLVIDCLDVSVEMSLRAKVFSHAYKQGIFCISAPVIGFGVLQVVCNPEGETMTPFISFLDKILRTKKLPNLFRNAYSDIALDSIEQNLG